MSAGGAGGAPDPDGAPRPRRAADAGAMAALGAALAPGTRALARAGPPAALVWLEGPLGAGKTTLVRGLLAALGVRGPVRSPTYTLVEPYPIGGGASVYHLDLYRLADPEELEDLGLRDLLGAPAVIAVEWPERGAGVLPAPDLEVRIATRGTARAVTLAPASARARAAWGPALAGPPAAPAPPAAVPGRDDSSESK